MGVYTILHGMNDSLGIALVAAVGSVIAGFFKLIDNQNKLHAKLAQSIDKMASSSEKVAKATQQGNREAKERNGHLAEMTIQQGDRIADLVGNVNKQHVATQVVDKQEIN